MNKPYVFRVVYVNRDGKIYEDDPFFYNREDAVDQATADILNGYLSEDGYDFVGFYVVDNRLEPLD